MRRRRKLGRLKYVFRGIHVIGKYEIEARHSCYFIGLGAHEVAEIRTGKCYSAVKFQQQRRTVKAESNEQRTIYKGPGAERGGNAHQTVRQASYLPYNRQS